MINVVADIFFVGEHLMNGASCPRSSKVRDYTLSVKRHCNFRFAFPLVNKCMVNPSHHFGFLIRSWNQNHPIRLKALVLPHLEHCFVLTVLINQRASQAESSSASLFEPHLDQAAG